MPESEYTREQVAAMPCPNRIRYRIYRRGFESGTSTMPGAIHSNPYQRADYRALYQRGFDAGASLLETALALHHLRLFKPVELVVFTDDPKSKAWARALASEAIDATPS